MIKMVIVPNSLRNEINKRLDAALKEQPGASEHREVFFHDLLRFFDENGYIPEFDITPKPIKETSHA